MSNAGCQPLWSLSLVWKFSFESYCLIKIITHTKMKEIGIFYRLPESLFFIIKWTNKDGSLYYFVRRLRNLKEVYLYYGEVGAGMEPCTD